MKCFLELAINFGQYFLLQSNENVPLALVNQFANPKYF